MTPISENAFNKLASVDEDDYPSKQMPSLSAASHSTSEPPRKTDATDDFPSLTHATEDDREKLSGWQEATRKKTGHKGATASDPFAGMDAFVDYQKEIERLKAMVAKAEPKKRTSVRPKSVHAELPTVTRTASPVRSSWNEVSSRKAIMHTTKTNSLTNFPSDATSPPSYARDLPSLDCPSAPSPIISLRSTSPTISEHTTKSQASSLSRATSPVADEGEPTKSVITEEEKARFLAFVRSWTGGWRAWSDPNDHPLGLDGAKAGSLWAKQSPWDRRSKPPATVPYEEASSRPHWHYASPSMATMDRGFASHAAMPWNEQPLLHAAPGNPTMLSSMERSMKQPGAVGEQTHPQGHGSFQRMSQSEKPNFGLFVM